MTANPTMPEQTSETASRSEPRRLHRSRMNRVLAGVCGGIADTYGSDPTAVRLATVVLGLFTGIVPMIVIYVIAAIVVPEAGDAVSGEPGPRAAPGQAGLVLGAVLIVIGIASLANFWFSVNWNQIWPLVLIAVGGVLVAAAWRR